MSTISATGLATAVAQGSTTITASSGSISGSTSLTVTAAALVSIVVTPANPAIALGTTQQFTATGTFTDGSTQNMTNSATWTSSATDVATVSASALATSVAVGTATISATSGSVTGSTTLTVSSASLVSIAVTPGNPAIALGTTQQFTATGTYSDGSTQDLTATASWTSSALNVATISDSAPTMGLATSTGTGTTTITATSDTVSGSATLTITQATLVSIAVTPANPSIALGTTQQFNATGTFTDGSTQDLTTTVTWSSSANTVAVISNNAGSQGLATSAAQGTTTITATSGAIAGSTSLTVAPPQLVSLAVTPTNPVIAQGDRQQFTATGTYTDGSTQDLTTAVTWTSSNTAVASINNIGLAPGLGTGTTTISAASGSIASSVTLTVIGQGAVLTSITVSPASPSIAAGTTQQFTAIGNYSDGSTQDLTTLANWGSSNTAVVTISSTSPTQGLATSLTAGSSTITAIWEGVTGSTVLTVGPPVLVSVAVTPANGSIALGTMQQFTATGTFTDGSTQDLTISVSWSSSNPAVATISNAAGNQGLATSVAIGSTTISATSGSVSGTTSFTVNPAAVVSIAVTPAIPAIPLGTPQQFTATGTFSDGSTQDLTQSVQWSSGSPGVATISNASGSQGLATSVATGSSTITAMSGSVSGSTTLTVTSAVLASIAVTPANPAIALGTTQQFTATGTYTDGSTQNLTNSATWVSSDANVATINASGLGSTVAVGTATISATSGSISGSTALTVTPAALVSIAVSPINSSIALGTTQQFAATGTFTDGTTQNLTTSVYWTSSALNVATISDSSPTLGLATSTGTGSTTITAASGSITGSATLTVTPAALESIAVTPVNPTIALGTTQQFTATGTFTDGSTQDLTGTVTWTSSAPSVAVVSNNTGTQGLATSAALGATTITANSGPITGSTGLTVSNAQLVSLAVTPSNPTITQDGTEQFTATGTYTDGSTQDLTAAVTWTSSNTAVASINTTGLADGLFGGTATITAASGSITNSTVLTVTPLVVLTSIALTPSNPSISVAGNQQFTATGTYSDGSTQNLTSLVTWTSSSPAVATIQTAGQTSPGLLAGAAAGTTTITATYSSVGSSLSVTIAANNIKIPIMDMTPAQNYYGFQGGLYPNVTDSLTDPNCATGCSQHDADGQVLATQIAAACGSAKSAQCIMLAIGMSNANLEFGSFRTQWMKSTTANHTTVTVINGAQSGMVACTWEAPFGLISTCPANSGYNGRANPFDMVLNGLIAPAGYTESQVKVVWIENANEGPSVSLPMTTADAYNYESELGKIVRASKQRYANAVLMFIGSRNYGGYGTKTNPEPYAYEYGFSTKWLIQAQINQIQTGTIDPTAGDLNYNNGTAPWLAWGAYTWANGAVPRSDGLIWCDGTDDTPGPPCNGEDDFSTTDDIHPSSVGASKTANLMMKFFTASPYSTPWFMAH